MAKRNYYRKLQPKTKPITRKILSEHFSTPSAWDHIQAAAALHFYIKRKIPYDHRDTPSGRRPLRNSLETWRNGGNCEEKGILLCNLLHNIKGIRTRMLAVGKPDSCDGHLVPEVGFPNSVPEITGKLDSYYDYLESEHGYSMFGSEFSYTYDKRNRIVWYVVDPGYSHYIGDIKMLVSDEFIEDDGEEWDWKILKEIISPENHYTEI